MLSTDLFTLLISFDLIVHGNSQYGKSLSLLLSGQLWCQQGSHKLYSPTQCPAQTLECFKFVCDAEEEYHKGVQSKVDNEMPKKKGRKTEHRNGEAHK
ncbi:hypothetical protein ANCDUO_01771 [Ancylostoma duodenale]|uniref:Uncharacterized protein n=1 Tax=Ancylostoma duodenale TaxID=51022 RepID=A0A0C2DDE6_9BILA|nr:hypothetical protein ANCDUO_01771 [Ancylostoma duodenale]